MSATMHLNNKSTINTKPYSLVPTNNLTTLSHRTMSHSNNATTKPNMYPGSFLNIHKKTATSSWSSISLRQTLDGSFVNCILAIGLIAACIVALTTAHAINNNHNSNNYKLADRKANEIPVPNSHASPLHAQQHHQQQQQQQRCAPGWIWYTNKCWISTASRRDWTHALELCQRMYIGSTLPTIHSEAENEFLRNNIDLSNSPMWIYAKHNHEYNVTLWQDKSSVNYTHWDNGQPSDKTSLVCIKTEDNWYMRKTDPTDGNTECISFWQDGKWTTSVGCNVLLPVVCEKKLPPPSPAGVLAGSPADEAQTSPLSSASNLGINTQLFIASTFVPLVLAYMATFGKNAF